MLACASRFLICTSSPRNCSKTSHAVMLASQRTPAEAAIRVLRGEGPVTARCVGDRRGAATATEGGLSKA